MDCSEILLCGVWGGLAFLLLSSLCCLLAVVEGKLCLCCVDLAGVVICVCKLFRVSCGVVVDLGILVCLRIGWQRHISCFR